MRALVLAAGLGTRLAPLTEVLPKPLAPVAGRPVIEHLLLRLADAGIHDVALNLHWHADAITSRLGDGERFGLRLSYVHEKELTGPAGALRSARHVLGGEDVMVLSGDGVHDVPLDGLLARHRESGAAATITVKRIPHPETCAIVDLDEEGLVTRFVEKPPLDEVFTDLASIGIYCFSQEVLDLIPGEGMYDIASELIPDVMAHGMPVAAFHTDAYWNDVGTPEELLSANLAVVSGEVRSARPAPSEVGAGDGVQVYSGTSVAADAVLKGPSAIGPNAEIGAGAHVLGAVVLPGARVPAGALVAGGIFGDPAALAAAWAAGA